MRKNEKRMELKITSIINSYTSALNYVNTVGQNDDGWMLDEIMY